MTDDYSDFNSAHSDVAAKKNSTLYFSYQGAKLIL